MKRHPQRYRLPHGIASYIAGSGLSVARHDVNFAQAVHSMQARRALPALALQRRASRQGGMTGDFALAAPNAGAADAICSASRTNASLPLAMNLNTSTSTGKLILNLMGLLR